MPLYEYKCDTCGGVFEVIQKFSDQPVLVHENCGGAVHRLVSRSALQFKGSGWYVNDYAKGSGKAPANGSEGKDGKDAKESKPADKPSGESKTSDTATPAASSTPSTKKSE